jgi:hypothetical protein
MLCSSSIIARFDDTDLVTDAYWNHNVCAHFQCSAQMRMTSMQARQGAWCTGICWLGWLLNETLYLHHQLMIMVSAQP